MRESRQRSLATSTDSASRLAPVQGDGEPSGLIRSIETARYRIFVAIATTSFVPIDMTCTFGADGKIAAIELSGEAALTGEIFIGDF